MPIAVSPGSALTFWHQHYSEGSFDGAVLELSVDSGKTWQDLGPYIVANGYDGTISDAYDNPLAKRPAWVGDLGVWTRVQVDLSSFAGHSIQIRWRIGCDIGIGDEGWTIDDIQITTPLPVSGPPQPSAVQPNSGPSDIRTTIMIVGEAFRPTVVVMLGDVMLSGVNYIDDATLSAIVPAGLAAGAYDLTVINGDCQSTTLNRAYLVDPSIRWYLSMLPLILK